MSLSVRLSVGGSVLSDSIIYVREGGRTVVISQEEWDRRNPDREALSVREVSSVYYGNITHNLTQMARACGLYQHLWRPEELGITKAGALIPKMIEGLHVLRQSPDHFRKYNPENGWGDYDSFVAFVIEYLEACQTYPEAVIGVSR